MRSWQEKLSVLFAIILVVMAGCGLTRFFDYMGTSNAWPAVFAMGIGAAIWFGYMNITEGFGLRRRKNQERVYQYTKRMEEEHTKQVSQNLLNGGKKNG